MDSGTNPSGSRWKGGRTGRKNANDHCRQEGLRFLGRNIEAFAPSELDAVITACGTCGTALKERYGVVAERENREWKEKVEAFNRKIPDIS